MRRIAHRTIVSLSTLFPLLILAGCGGPWVLLPGGTLTGEVTPVPASWDFTDEISTIQIESQPSDPYSVNIWATRAGDHLYIHAGANRARWVEHIEVDPKIRLRVDAKIFELTAARVTDSDEFNRFAIAYEKKYGSRPRNENVSEVYAYRLTPR